MFPVSCTPYTYYTYALTGRTDSNSGYHNFGLTPSLLYRSQVILKDHPSLVETSWFELNLFNQWH